MLPPPSTTPTYTFLPYPTLFPSPDVPVEAKSIALHSVIPAKAGISPVVSSQDEGPEYRVEDIEDTVGHPPCAVRDAASFASAATRTNRNGVHVARDRKSTRLNSSH